VGFLENDILASRAQRAVSRPNCGTAFKLGFDRIVGHSETTPVDEMANRTIAEIGVSLNELSRALRAPMNRVSAIVNGKRAITVDTSMRLARYFGTPPQLWLNLQTAYDLEVDEQRIGPRIEKEVLPRTAA
jgi:addiction module HigA family antidote